jgi:hypothetical protein
MRDYHFPVCIALLTLNLTLTLNPSPFTLHPSFQPQPSPSGPLCSHVRRVLYEFAGDRALVSSVVKNVSSVGNVSSVAHADGSCAGVVGSGRTTALSTVHLSALLSKGTLADPVTIASLIGYLSRKLQPDIALALYEVILDMDDLSLAAARYNGDVDDVGFPVITDEQDVLSSQPVVLDAITRACFLGKKIEDILQLYDVWIQKELSVSDLSCLTLLKACEQSSVSTDKVLFYLFFLSFLIALYPIALCRIVSYLVLS